MEKLQESLELLQTIKDFSCKEEVSKVSKQAFETCLFCLEAACLLAKTIDSEASREFFLFNAIKDVEIKIEEDKINDPDVFNSLMLGYLELAQLYLDYGRYTKAKRFLMKLDNLDKEGRFKTKYRLLTLEVYLEDDERVDELFEVLKENSFEKEDQLRLYLPYTIHLYKRLAYDSLVSVKAKIDNINPSLFKILKGEILENNQPNKEELQALKIIKNNAYLINSCPHFIEALKELYD